MITIILASASPRRTALLTQAGIDHLVTPSSLSENTVRTEPSAIVEDLSGQKAHDVLHQYCADHPEQNIVVIGADTIVALGPRVLGKPGNDDEARQMLTALQNSTHQVYTGVTLISRIDQEKRQISFHECSHVTVYPMDPDEINAYITTGEPADKAGAYGIQGQFAIHVKGISGDYNNIVGLPIARLYQE